MLSADVCPLSPSSASGNKGVPKVTRSTFHGEATGMFTDLNIPALNLHLYVFTVCRADGNARATTGKRVLDAGEHLSRIIHAERCHLAMQKWFRPGTMKTPAIPTRPIYCAYYLQSNIEVLQAAKKESVPARHLYHDSTAA